MRIHELARELGVPSKDILASLDEMGYEGRTASSTVPEEAVPRLRAAGGRVKPGIKPRTATEETLARLWGAVLGALAQDLALCEAGGNS